MQWLIHEGEVRHRKLYRELRAVQMTGSLSLSPTDVVAATVDDPEMHYTRVGFADSRDPATIQAVLDAHDPTTPDAVEQAELTAAENETALRDRIDQAVTTLEQAQTNWPTLTQTQKDTALRLNVRVTVALARLHLRKLESI